MRDAAVEKRLIKDKRLLDAALDVFLEKGFPASTVDEIAARARAAKLTFYKRYGNKEAVFAAVVARQSASLDAALWEIIPQGVPIEELLETVATRIHATLLKKEMVKLVRVLHAEAIRFPKLAQIFDSAGPAKGIRMLAQEIEKRMDAGTLRKVSPTLAAEQFFQLAFGEATRRLLLDLRPSLSKAETTERIAGAIDVFVRAYSL